MKIKVGRAVDNDWRSPDGRVSGHHCTVTVSDDGRISVEDHSTNGTFFKGEKKTHCSFSVTKNDTISLAGVVNVPVSEILACIKAATEPEFDFKEAERYTDFRKVLNEYRQLTSLKAYRENAEKVKDSLPPYVMPSIISAIAAKEMRSGHLGAAQKLLYEAGDLAYSALDQKPEMENCYAAMMALLCELYCAAYRFDAAEKAGRYAVGIYSRWENNDDQISLDSKGYAISVFAEALRANGKHEGAKSAYRKALETYKKAAPSNPMLYSAKIRELEEKIR